MGAGKDGYPVFSPNSIQPIKASLLNLLLILTSLPPSRASDAVSVKDFMAIKDPKERERIIERAPPGQQLELKKANIHLDALSHFGFSEDDLRYAKERRLSRERPW